VLKIKAKWRQNMAGEKVILSLGGNQGDIKKNFEQAVVSLENGGLRSIVQSPLYCTAPVGCAEGTPDFINGALSGIWEGSLDSLFNLCKDIEVKAGRPLNHQRYASRTLDLDIIFFGDLIYSDKKLTIPHREALNRFFVLIPMADIAGAWLFPGQNGLTVKGILDDLKIRNIEEFNSIKVAEL
jgi:2-amino-4-hydroxy-6-hydroxymethyldihydropteridine diphosphokinase